MEWVDARLKWDESSYGGITSLVTPPEDIWTPPVVIENAFPFDNQECDLILLGWTYPLSELVISASGIDTTTLYSSNGEFDLTGTSTALRDIGGPEANTTYRKVHFYFSFRRKWQFYGQNLLMPIVLNSILMVAVFALPIESGEKMGFSLTVLLSYVVFLTWVTDNLPPTSTDVAVVQVYLAVVLCLGVLATLLTTWILHLFDQNGVVYWTPPTELTTSCEMNVEEFPFDSQECKVVLLGWTYPLSEMIVTASHKDLGGPAANATFRKLDFYFSFRRKWPFYGQNLLMPIVLNSILMVAVFALPIESGEKMGFSLTVLLSYVVFLTWVTDNLPPTSTDVSVVRGLFASPALESTRLFVTGNSGVQQHQQGAANKARQGEDQVGGIQ
nr:hypothetical protein BaRGS_027457 [Batillaria attramentaria]